MKEIQLTQGRVAQVSDEDFEYLNSLKWYYVKSGYAKGRPHRNTPEMIMHRTVLQRMGVNLADGGEVDHIDRNGLNNQRENLRLVSHIQNVRNSNRIARAKGVSFDKKTGKYRAKLIVFYRAVYCEYFEKEDDAILAYQKAKQLFIKE